MSDLVLKAELEIHDEIDALLIEKVLPIVQDRDNFELVKVWGYTKFGIDGVEEKYFKIIFSVIRSLVKANHHRRSYTEQELRIKRELIKESRKAESAIDLIYEKPDLISEFDGFLTQIKAGLDSLAVSLNPIYGTSLNGWHKKGGISGKGVVASIRSLPVGGLGDSNLLAQFIEDNYEYISYIVSLRDAPIHRGDHFSVYGFRYLVKEDKLQEPFIFHGQGNTQLLSVFMKETILNFARFTQIFISLSLSNLIKGWFLDEDGEGNFRWFMRS